MPIKEMLGRGHEARMCSPRNPVRNKEKREKGTERKRQATGQHDDGRRPHAAHNAVRSTAPRSREDCKLLNASDLSSQLSCFFITFININKYQNVLKYYKKNHTQTLQINNKQSIRLLHQ